MPDGALVRPARFAGSWYPSDPAALRAEIEAATPDDVEAAPALAVLAPHAGYRFSLGVAAETYARVAIPSTVIVLCPNHTVAPGRITAWPGGRWETPLGPVPIDEALTGDLQLSCDAVELDTDAHDGPRPEHAIELHLPILQVHRPDLKLVALVVGARGLGRLEALGEAIATAVAERKGDVLIVASTDMTHFETAETARRQDERALAHVDALDPAGLLETCEREGITMCGVRPTTAALVAAKRLGATRVERVRYANSGDVSGDNSSVVGYAGVVIR